MYASVSISSNTTCVCVCKYFERLRYNASGDRNPNTLKYKTTDKRKSRARHVTRTCLCMTTSIIIKITRDQHVNIFTLIGSHWITVSCHGVEGPMTSGYYCAIFPFCGGGKKKKKKKKKRRQKNKGILRLGYHRYPSNKPRTTPINTRRNFLHENSHAESIGNNCACL